MGSFTWRGVVREDRPLRESERSPRRGRGNHDRCIFVPEEISVRDAAILQAIADRRGITFAEALELVCADVLETDPMIASALERMKRRA